MLMYRFHTLDGARAKARALGFSGALYPWESVAGHEATPTRPVGADGKAVEIFTGRFAHHISADVAHAVWQYWQATADDDFLIAAGAEIILETARFWASRAVREADGLHHIRRVVGPDEYHEPVRVVWRAIQAAQRCGHTIVLDPSPADRLDDSMCRTIDFVTPNTTETELLTGMPVRSLADGFRAGERLLARGVGAALVKLGAEGCAFVSGGARFHVRAEPRNVVDTTGAGDAFTGGLAVALLERRSTEDAVRFAVAASALAVLRYGSQSSYPCRDELERELPRIVTRSATL
jgi:sugar/nucleoside kinase (ribokinase family)